MIFLLVLWGVIVARLPRDSALDLVLFVLAAALFVPMLIASAWYSFVVERVTSAPDEFILETRALGVSLGSPRRAKKADIVGTGLHKLTFYRMLRDGARARTDNSLSGWTMTIQCRKGPSESTELPLGDEDAEALIAFVRSELAPKI